MQRLPSAEHGIFITQEKNGQNSQSYPYPIDLEQAFPEKRNSQHSTQQDDPNITGRKHISPIVIKGRKGFYEEVDTEIVGQAQGQATQHMTKGGLSAPLYILNQKQHAAQKRGDGKNHQGKKRLGGFGQIEFVDHIDKGIHHATAHENTKRKKEDLKTRGSHIGVLAMLADGTQPNSQQSSSNTQPVHPVKILAGLEIEKGNQSRDDQRDLAGHRGHGQAHAAGK